MTIPLPPDLVPQNESEKKIAETVLTRISGVKPFRASPRLTDYHRKLGRFLMRCGFRQHDIAAAMGVNQGRLSETKHNQ
jgi:hypothetical protein